MSPKYNSSSVSMRLQRYLAQAGLGSRRHCEELIKLGKIKVNGKVATLGSKIVPSKDKVEFDGATLKTKDQGIILLHKPIYVVSTMRDPQGRQCIADFLTPRYRNYFPVGRLDFESCGLVILTNDGDLADKLLHPRFQMTRTYIVEIEGPFKLNMLQEMKRGVHLEDGPIKANAKLLKQAGKVSELSIEISEGRNRVIRRLMQKLGLNVLTLKRIGHGPFRLGKLKPGQLRKLSEKEYVLLKRATLKKC